MKAVQLFQIIFVLILTQNGLSQILNILNPVKWLGTIDHIAHKLNKPPSHGGYETEKPVDKPIIETATPKEILFDLAPKLQGLFDPGDPQANENYIISPLSAGILLGQFLIGTYSWNHNVVAKFLGLSLKTPSKRDIQIINEINDPFFDTTIHHASFHISLNAITRNIETDLEQDKVSLKTGFFYQQGTDLVKHFQRNMNKMYVSRVTFTPVDFHNSLISTEAVSQWGKEHNETDLKERINGFINTRTQSFFLHSCVVKTTWKIPLEVTHTKEDFYISPNQQVKTNYLQGIIKNTAYVDFEDFQLVGIPLNHADTYVYILLPQSSRIPIYNIRSFSESLNSKYFQESVKRHKILRNVRVKIPDIFSQYIVDFDVMKPILNYVRSENEEMGKYVASELKLNGASRDLNINNLIQHLHLSINNKEQEKIPADFAVTTDFPFERPTLPNIVTSTIPVPLTIDFNSVNHNPFNVISLPNTPKPNIYETYPHIPYYPVTNNPNVSRPLYPILNNSNAQVGVSNNRLPSYSIINKPNDMRNPDPLQYHVNTQSTNYSKTNFPYAITNPGSFHFSVLNSPNGNANTQSSQYPVRNNPNNVYVTTLNNYPYFNFKNTNPVKNISSLKDSFPNLHQADYSVLNNPKKTFSPYSSTINTRNGKINRPLSNNSKINNPNDIIYRNSLHFSTTDYPNNIRNLHRPHNFVINSPDKISETQPAYNKVLNGPNAQLSHYNAKKSSIFFSNVRNSGPLESMPNRNFDVINLHYSDHSVSSNFKSSTNTVLPHHPMVTYRYGLTNIPFSYNSVRNKFIDFREMPVGNTTEANSNINKPNDAKDLHALYWSILNTTDDVTNTRPAHDFIKDSFSNNSNSQTTYYNPSAFVNTQLPQNPVVNIPMANFNVINPIRFYYPATNSLNSNINTQFSHYPVIHPSNYGFNTHPSQYSLLNNPTKNLFSPHYPKKYIYATKVRSTFVVKNNVDKYAEITNPLQHKVINKPKGNFYEQYSRPLLNIPKSNQGATYSPYYGVTNNHNAFGPLYPKRQSKVLNIRPSFYSLINKPNDVRNQEPAGFPSVSNSNDITNINSPLYPTISSFNNILSNRISNYYAKNNPNGIREINTLDSVENIPQVNSVASSSQDLDYSKINSPIIRSLFPAEFNITNNHNAFGPLYPNRQLKVFNIRPPSYSILKKINNNVKNQEPSRFSLVSNHNDITNINSPLYPTISSFNTVSSNRISNYYGINNPNGIEEINTLHSVENIPAVNSDASTPQASDYPEINSPVIRSLSPSDLIINNSKQPRNANSSSASSRNMNSTKRPTQKPINFNSNSRGKNGIKLTFVQETRSSSVYQNRIKRDLGGSEESVVDFEVTRPFVFIIMKESTKAVLVWGSISNPEKLHF